MKILGKYRLKKYLPNLPRGVIFEHREYDEKYPYRGSPACGSLILGWDKGMCQGGWSEGTYVLPGQLINNKEWFENIELSLVDQILSEIEALKERVKRLQK